MRRLLRAEPFPLLRPGSFSSARSRLSLDQHRFFFSLILSYLVPSRVEGRPLEPRNGWSDGVPCVKQWFLRSGPCQSRERPWLGLTPAILHLPHGLPVRSTLGRCYADETQSRP